MPIPKQCYTCGVMFQTQRAHAKTCSPKCRMKMMRYIRRERRRVESLRRLKSFGFPVA